MPLENYDLRDRSNDRDIDRLVDGELPDGERRRLLLRLESEPDGWRRCALAFLEAQSWRAAFRPLAATDGTVPQLPVTPAGRHHKPRKRLYVARLAALAACFAVAFALGWGLHGGAAKNSSDAAIARPESSAPVKTSEPLQSTPFELQARESRPVKPTEQASLLDPVVKKWEQRGYHAERQQRLISMELKDGRKVELPIHEVRLEYVGGRTY
jgi:anti-sigma factor RsiW